MITKADLDAMYNKQASKMKDPQTLQPNAKIMLYGTSGVGKTVLAAQILNEIMPDGSRILHIDTSEGWASYHNHKDETTNLKTQPFETVEDLRELAELIRYEVKEYANIRGLILDEGSTIARMDTDRIFEARVERGAADDDVPGWKDYHAALARWRRMLGAFSTIPNFHIIICAHETDVVDTKGNKKGVRPEFTPSILKRVKEPLNLVARLTSRPVKDPDNPDNTIFERMIQVHPSSTVDAKTRIFSEWSKFDAEWAPGFISDWLSRGGLDESEVPPDAEISSGVPAPVKRESVPEDETEDDADVIAMIETV